MSPTRSLRCRPPATGVGGHQPHRRLHRIRATLRSALNAAIREGLIRDNRPASWKCWQGPPTHAPPTAPQRDQARIARALYTALSERVRRGTRTPNPRIKILPLLNSRVHLYRVSLSPLECLGVLSGPQGSGDLAVRTGRVVLAFVRLGPCRSATVPEHPSSWRAVGRRGTYWGAAAGSVPVGLVRHAPGCRSVREQLRRRCARCRATCER